MAGEPAANNTGGTGSFAATKPKPGTHFNFQAETVQANISYLNDKRRSSAALVSGAPVLAN